MIRKLLLCLFSLVFIALASPVKGQQDSSIQVIEYDKKNKKSFEIGGVRVEGAEFSDEKAIIALSGLKVGDKLQIPGSKLQKAIKNLYARRLFTNVEIRQEKAVGEIIFIVIKVEERARLSRFAFRGVKKRKHDDLKEIVNRHLTKGGIITDDLKTNAIVALKGHYRKKGYLDAHVTVVEEKEEKIKNALRLIFEIDKKERIKIQDITFAGNTSIKGKKLRKLLGNTKPKKRFLAKSKLVQEDYESDKKGIIAFYNNHGYRDARILGDSIWRDEKGLVRIHISLEEGQQYFFRNLVWKGNTLHHSDRLSAILGISKGDIYNSELLNERLRFSLDGRDISSLYLDDGYLFFNVDPVEVAISGDSIDIEMRIFEGPQATIDRVEVTGNDRTHDHVILRELRTRPGQKFSRSDIIRSQRELLNLGFFDPESMNVETPVNPQRGTVDIKYDLAERPSDQLELSAGWGGRGAGVFGTLGIVFNNFSIRNVFNKNAWKPLPQGDGQKLSLRFQSNGRFWRSFNASFTEPWLGGKKPNSFTVGGSTLKSSRSFDGDDQILRISRLFAGLGTRLPWPDDNFVSNTTANFEIISLKNRAGFALDDGTSITNGSFYNFSINQTIARTTINEPIFPKSGSRISLSVQLTPPYSLFRSDNATFFLLSDSERTTLISDRNAELVGAGLSELDPTQEASLIQQEELSNKFNFLEYHKWRFDAEWYAQLFGKWVIKTEAKIGMVGAYNQTIGLTPFERFELGGDGLSNQQAGIEGKDIISLRGYEAEDLPGNESFFVGENGILQSRRNGAAIFNKFTVELRYPVSTNPNSTIYLHTFVQGGNVFKTFGDYNPFDLRRSFGGGLRVFLPMFGILGFDYGYGIDKTDLIAQGAGLGQFAKFSIVLGFEPD